MQLHHNLSSFPQDINPVVTVGMFDGVHRGHLTVIDRVVNLAQDSGVPSVVVTFEPHPRLFFQGEESGFKLLSTLEEKTSLIENAGIDHLVVLPFNQALSTLTPEEFVVGVLVNGLNASVVVMGPDHHFGKGRQGGLETLNMLATDYNFRVEQISTQEMEEVKVSSTRIREALAAGDLDRAWLFLGYPYPLSGTVIMGDKIGRTMGFPTVNLSISPDKLIPANGVYAVLAEHRSKALQGMCNIGMRPTVFGDKLTIEVNLFDFNEVIYGEEVRIAFMEKIRDERKFENLDALKHQLELDRSSALKILSE